MDHRHPCQVIAVPDEIFVHGGPIAARDAVAPDPVLFQVRGGNDQRIAVPLTGRKPLPGMPGVIRRMRPAIHPDGLFRAVR